ncbi:MAG: excinuclease ABC subunit UvrC [Candidatus Levybacteria bacterium]|nr:excinuclease ABC subunit UvrC [Candidatus Levybacteria bacterium]
MSLPKKPGVYRFLDRDKHILYVGKAIDIRSRVSSYFTNKDVLLEKTRVMVSQIETIEVTIVESEIESLLLEAYLIKKFQPKYNVRMTDGKSYPLIQITTKDTYPAIIFARKPEDPKSYYFGPYPSSGSVKRVLKLLRRVFPYVSVRNHPKRVCLYHHLGLCPCPPVFDSPELRKTYKKHIRQIVGILEGNARGILRELEKERNALVKEECFEEANNVHHQITALSYVTQPFRQAFEYDVNPNLRSDMREKELVSLRDVLVSHGLDIDLPHKIECYDISNIQGTNATGSMVVFVGGEKESSLYRKYKIRRRSTPDDFASMEEVLTRRLKHTEWEYPDLLVVDGGKGQITSALKAIAKFNLQIPLIGLAKREETIVIPVLASQGHALQEKRRKYSVVEDLGFVEILLPKDSPGLTLLRRIRDEAHRFAVTYHRSLRSKQSLR